MKKISVIIGFYDGNKYMSKLKKIIDSNYELLREIVELEIIFINDSPWIDVRTDIFTNNKYSVKVINHKKNEGIHQARVTGIYNASGEYVMILDQDDIIRRDCILILYDLIEATNCDCVIGNGVFQTKDGEKIILNTYGKTILAKDYHSYLIMGNLLCSPGQTMIRKSAIDIYWMENIVKTNCSDDLFLWCLLMKQKNIVYCNELVYIHINTGENISLDKTKGIDSDKEVLDLLRKKGTISPIFLKVFEMRCKYRMKMLNTENRKKIVSVYPAILNIWKIYGMLLTIMCVLTGKRLPKYIDNSGFEY